VYDAEDRLVFWNDRYEKNAPKIFENHRALAESGKLTFRELLRIELQDTENPEDLGAEIDRRIAERVLDSDEPIDRYFDVIGHLRSYRFGLDGGNTASLAMDINDLVALQEELETAHRKAEEQNTRLEQLISEQHRVSEEIERAERRFRSLVDHATDGITVVDVDSGLFVEEANAQVQKLYGYSRSELLDVLGPADVSPSHQPDGRTSLEAATAYFTAAFEGEAQTFEWTHIHRSGTLIPCQVTLARFPHPVRNAVRASVIDLTEQKKIEARYRQLVDQADDGITILDIDTGLFTEEANPSLLSLFGCSREDILDKRSPVDFSPEFQPDGRPSREAAFGFIMAAFEGQPQRFDWVHQDINARAFPCEITLTRFPHPTRRLIRASIVDLTAQKKAEEARRDLEKQLARSHRLELIGQMTGGVAHDFNNVLSVLLGNLEVLESKAEELDTKKTIRNAIDAAEQGAGLTRAMLNYARQAPLKPETLDLNRVVAHMENLISSTIPARIKIEIQLDDENWSVAADRSNTESAILNLVLNACDAMPNDGQIKIITESVLIEKADLGDDLPAGTYRVLSVQDTGVGIPLEEIDRIFEPFFTTKGVGQNSGLGLSMVQGFMTQTGGTMRVQSQVGVGTTMQLYFPVAAGEGNAVPVPTRPIVAIEHESEPAKILLIEDNDIVAMLTEATLQRHGHTVVTANSTDSAIALFAKHPDVQLLVTDIAIPGHLQGPALAAHFKEQRPELPVIFVSGYSFGLEAQAAGLRETDVLLTKPVREKHLINAVNAALATNVDA